ncbi:MAG: alpha/beta fold hydrolase [Comamonadaceae bacterium]
MHRRLVLQNLGVAAIGAPSLGIAQSERASAPLPLEYFVRRPLMERVKLSPDGKRLAAIINNGNNSLLITRGVGGGGISTVLHSDNLEYLFNWFQWINNDRLVVSLRYPYQRKLPYSTKVVPTMETRLLAIDPDGSNAINVLRSKGLSGSTGWAVVQDNVIDWLRDDGKHLLLTLSETDQDSDGSVYKVNVYTGERQHYHGSRHQVGDWITDHAHRVRVGFGYGGKSESVVWVCDPDGNNWREFNRAEAFSSTRLSPLGFGLDPNLLYVSARYEGLEALHTVDLREKAPTPKLKFSHARFDLNGQLIFNFAGEAVGMSIATPSESSAHYWHPSFQAWQDDLDRALPDRKNMIAHMSRDESLCVVVSGEASRPAEYFVCTRQAITPRLIARQYPELHDKPVSAKADFSYMARDGLKIYGFLSLPGGRVPKSLPLVVFPHGGPQASDGPEFDYWAAFMADRGYAVLQPNFRGSTGYGKPFMDAGLRRWGLEMQDDLSDGVAELIRLGIADAKRIAIVGASYGGYAALMGVCKTPRLYCGAFAFAPVTDLVELTAEVGQFTRREAVRKQIGESRDDKERLLATSPRFLADRIEKPVVLVHGTHDRQAQYEHSVWMADALKTKGKAFKFVTLDRGDHQLSHLPYRKQVLELLETFLAETAGGTS